MFQPDHSQPALWAYPVGPPPGCERAWEFHLSRDCPGWATERQHLTAADHFSCNLGQAMDQYCALAAEQGMRRMHFVVCRCVVGAAHAPRVHATATVHLNLE